MPVSLTLTTTLELPVVRSHACGAEIVCIHHCCGNSTSFGVTANNARRSRGQKTVRCDRGRKRLHSRQPPLGGTREMGLPTEPRPFVVVGSFAAYPFPSLSSTANVALPLESEFTTTMSVQPSPLKSPAPIAPGLGPGLGPAG